MASDLGEKPEAFSTSLYVTDRKAFEECKRLLKLQGRSLSEEIMDFVLRRRDELKGIGSTESNGDSTRRFEELKAQHFQSGQKADKLKAALEEKKVYDNYMKRFGEVLGYDPGESWENDECVTVIIKFLKHSSDIDWKRVETRFLISCKAAGTAHTFLDYIECCRERRKIERKLLEMRTDPEELARIDERERQEEEQRKKDAEARRALEVEEARKQKEQDESEDPYEEEEDDEEEGFTAHVDDNLTKILEEEKKAKEEDQEEAEERPAEKTALAERSQQCRAIVPVWR